MVACWYAALMFGLLAYSVAEWLCPPDEIVSGFCMAHWFYPAERAAIYLGAATAAILMVSISTLLAPSHKRLTAHAIYLLGCIAALAMALYLNAYAEMAAATLAGAATLVIVRRFIGRAET